MILYYQRKRNEVRKDGANMTLAGSMTISIYDSEIHEIHHDLGYWIINTTYWYPDNKYTEEQAKAAFLSKDADKKGR